MPIWIEQDPEYLRGEKAIAGLTEYEETGEPVIVIGRRIGGEVMAHEIGHAVSGHKWPPPEDPSETARHEVEAWLWAQRKRGKPLRTSIVARVAINLMKRHPDMPEGEIIAIIRNAYYGLGGEPPSEDYIRRVLEKEFGFED